MEPMDWLPASDADLIGSAMSIEGVVDALTAHGCSNLTPLIDPGAFSEFPLAGGGYCDVYQGALKSGMRIAVKSLRVCPRSEETIDADRQKVLKRAAREMYCWSKLRHDNVLPLLGFTIFRGHLSMVSEWMHNGNLMAYRSRNPGMGWLEPCMEICAGLCYIHAAGIVHGDLKAANVMVSSDGVAVISDFGNTQIKDLTLEFTSTTGNGISLRWAAPELLLRDNGPETSKEADVYAYGMTILEVITGKVPYEGIADHRVLTLVAYEKRPPLRPAIEIHNELWAVLTSCWNQEPPDRPTIGCVSNRLEALFQLSRIGESSGVRQLDSASMNSGQNLSSERMIGPALNTTSAQPSDTSDQYEMDNEELHDGGMWDQEERDEEMNELTNGNSSGEMNITSPYPTGIASIYPHNTPDINSTSTDADSVRAMSISGSSLHSGPLTFGSVYSMSFGSLSLRSAPMSDVVPRSTSSQRWWTIADVDDEEFLRQLEARLSGAGGLPRQSRGMLNDFTMGANQSGAELEDHREPDTDDGVAEREWIRVRREMMCVREIVRTEKIYLRHLTGFRDSEDASNMSPILAEHLPRLIETSRMFCSLLEGDQSAWGVSRAFLEAKEQLEATLVRWSGEALSSLYPHTNSRTNKGNGHTSSRSLSWIRRRSAGRTALPFNLGMTPANAVAGGSERSTSVTRSKGLTQQDIVIAPTQRTIRYTIMYQELLLHTSPTSVARKYIEQALQAAKRIACKCDEEAKKHVDRVPSQQ